MFSLFRSKQAKVGGAPFVERKPTPDELARWQSNYEESCRYLAAASKQELDEAIRDVDGIDGLLRDLGITFKADGNNVAIYWHDTKRHFGDHISISLSHASAFFRLIRHINTAHASVITDAQEMVGEELAAFGVSFGSTPDGFSVKQDGPEGAAATVSSPVEAVFLGMALALRRAGQERQQAQEPEPDPAAGAQIISFAAEQARRQGDDETF